MKCNYYIEIGGKVNDNFRRNIIIPILKKQIELKKYNFVDTYSTIYKYDNKNQNIANLIAPFYIDLDVNDLQNDFNKLKKDVLIITRRLKDLLKISEDNIEYYFSGSKGFHILIPESVLGIKPCKDLNDKYKTFASDLKSYTITKSIDTRIYDNKRLFREPNTINSKTGLYKVPISLEQIKQMGYEELIEYAKEPKDLIAINKDYNEIAEINFHKLIEEVKDRQKKTINYKVARQMMQNKELLPCVKYILQNGAVKGERNNTAMALASALYQRNPNDREEILDIMKTWNDTKLDNPLADRELEATVRSAYYNVTNGRRYGCAAFIDLGICVKGCPIRKIN